MYRFLPPSLKLKVKYLLTQFTHYASFCVALCVFPKLSMANEEFAMEKQNPSSTPKIIIHSKLFAKFAVDPKLHLHFGKF